VGLPHLAAADALSPTLIPALALFALAVLGRLILRRFPGWVRLIFDALFFFLFSAYLFAHAIFPVFTPLKGAVDSYALWLRAIGGAWWWLGARLLIAVIGFAVHRDRRSREARLFSDLAAAVIYIATATIVLNSVFSIPVVGVVATSGVVAIVLALALQNTLADVFAGIAVGIEAPFQVGDEVQIGDKTEGQIVQVNWRSVRVQTDGNDVAVIPHSVVAKAQIVNRSSPSQKRAATVQISCPVTAIPERVIEALQHAIDLCPDILTTPAPKAALVRMGALHSLYEVSFVVPTTSHLSATRDQLLRSARRQLDYAGLLDKCDHVTARVRLLRDLVLFESLPEENIAQLAAHLQSHRLEPGEVLFAQDSGDTFLYVIAAGVVELVCDNGTSQDRIGRMGAGEYLGDIALLTGAPHPATATAHTYCEVYRLARESITPLLSTNPTLAADFERSVRRGLSMLHREVAVRASPSIGPTGQLLARIRSIFTVRST
jgi:small-conductance mechanosensitive channel/CRP-like cAMP-binding protein